ncbi:MAG: indolepyruvate oxidoreductase subunit beta [Treponema sp.]|nr:indolepyruvate oxidoreductase subunit beta [Treponema sp.]
MSSSILICGIGGQGTVLASKLICQAALSLNMDVRSAETIGMAQRGGSVVSHVRIGSGLHSPLIPLSAADILIAFEPCEAVRNLPYLKKDGVIVVSDKVIPPVTASLSGQSFDSAVMIETLRKKSSRVMVLDTDSLSADLGSSKATNTLLLGAAAASGVLGVSLDDLKSALSVLVKPQFVELNVRALDMGAGVKG